MAGILANSASVTHASSGADDTKAGYVTGEQITLSTSPAGAAYSWGCARPSGSGDRAALSASSGTGVTFTPDVGGYYTVTCTVDSTTAYVLRLSVTTTAVSTSQEAIRLQPKTNGAVPTPPLGVAVYYSETHGAACQKDAAGAVRRLSAYSYSPSSSADTAGAVGDVSYDASYLYCRTASGWRRASAGSF